MEKSVNNEILNKVDEIVSEIKMSKNYQDYLFLKDKLKNNEKATNLISDIKKLQKEIVKKESLRQDITDTDKQLEEKINLLNQIPLYVEFIEKQEELNLTYQLLKQELDDYFNNLLN